MMSGPANIDSWFEFVVWAVIAIAALAGAVQAHRGRREHQEQSAVIGEVREQVSNTHDTNLRDDLDRTDSKVDQVDTKVDVLTGTVTALVHAFEEFAKETRAANARQDRIAAKHHPGE